MSSECTILVVVRTLTTFTWTLELLPELFADPRVQLVFTIEAEGSAYRDGAVQELARLGGRIVPWEQALATRFSLAISASPNGELERLRAPLLILPHGPGYSKHESISPNGAPPVPTRATTAGWHTMLAFSHEEQGRYWQADPTARVQTQVIGDPCVDRLRASIPARERYRRELGVSPSQKLVVTSSTWGPRASLARHPELPARLLAELPADEFVVAAILHPNIWVGHGPWQVRLWLRRALESGLRLMPPQSGWQAALVGGDLLICDHGSVSLYGIAVGLPIAFAAFADEEIHTGGPLAELARQAPHLAHERELREQVEQIWLDRAPDRYVTIESTVFAEPGRALENLRTLVYEAIDLEPPPQPPRVLPVKALALDLEPVSAHEVGGAVEATAPLRISLDRRPAGIGVQTGEAIERHILIADGEPDRRLHDTAAVVVVEPVGPERTSVEERRLEAIGLLQWVLEDHPGARVATCVLSEGHCVTCIRGEAPLETRLPGDVDPGLLASAIYLGWVDGRVDGDFVGEIEIVTGAQTQVVSVGGVEGLMPATPPAAP